VERDARAVAALRENIESLGVMPQASVLALDASRALERLAQAGERFAVVFLDPPYEGDLLTRALERTPPIVAPGGVVVAQHLTKRPPPAAVGSLEVFRARRFGETTLTFFRPRA
jgi:16S rRNA (guanine966-N2)-methyltransferase